MPPIRSPSFLHGSTPLPLSRPSASNGSVHTPYTRSLLGYPDLGGEPSQVAPPGLVDPTLYSEVPNSLNEQLDINLGHGHTHAAHHTAEPYPAVFGPGSRVMFQGGYPSFPQHTHFHRGYGIDGIQLLYQKASPAAAFNSKDRYDPPKCHPNTRVGLLTMTRNWSNKGRPRIMWLYGSAGAGKSAIAQTISEELRAASNLAASFFFSRTASADSHQGHEGRFVTTIAYQLSQTMPALRSYIEHAILNDSSVFDVTLREQVFKLIIKPLEALRNDQRNQNATCALPRIIVVDGLDECKEERGQQQVLDAIAFLVSHGDVFPFSVFVASRPEVVIRSWFTAYLTANPDLAQNVSLLDECDGDHDIEVFVRSEGAKIRQIHPFRSHIPADWPSGRVMKEIVKRASGQFIYAVTIMKYVRYLRDDPSRRLDDILQNTIPENHRPYAELDALYLHILRRTEHPLLVHRLFCFRIVSMSFFGYLNGDRVGEYLQKFLSLTCPVDILLVDLQSIMNCDIDGMKFGADLDMTAQRERVTSLGIRIPSIFHHASVVEFLLNPHRSEEFHIDTRQADKNLTEIAIKQVNDLNSDTSDERYIIYCFLIMLQTQTSLGAAHQASVAAALSRWDILNDRMLYKVLDRLKEKFGARTSQLLQDISHRNLWKVFGPVVARKRVQVLQDFHFNHPKIPQHLLYILQHPVAFGCQFSHFKGTSTSTSAFIHYHTPSSVTVKLTSGKVDLHQLVSDHISTSIQHCVGVDAWNHFTGSIQGTSYEDDHRAWKRCMYIWQKYASGDSAASEVQRNLLSEASTAFVHYIKEIILLLDTSQQITRPKSIQDQLDNLRRKKGEYWRTSVAEMLLHDIELFLWEDCHLSVEIATALEILVSKTHVRPHFVRGSDPRTLNLRPQVPCHANYPPYHCGTYKGEHLHIIRDYVRLFDIRCSDMLNIHNVSNGGTGVKWDAASDDIEDISAIPAYELALKTIDPVTGLSVGYRNWTLFQRLDKFRED